MLRNIRPIWIMIFFERLTIIFHHCYNFDLIKTFVLIINMMFYIPKIDDYLNILTDKEVKDFVAITFSEYCKSTREEQNLTKSW